jgi:SAM-dependent methyltransferase
MDVEDYYDRMHAWTLRDSGFASFSGFEHAAIHRFLADPESGEFSPRTVYRLIGPHLPRREDFLGLDAGCGYGATAFHLLPRTGGSWHGVTLSATQVAVAERLAAERGLSDRLRFARQSYDAPLPARYDAVVAIESLAHSPDPAASLRNLAAHLRPGGVLVLVDDMPREAPPAEEAAMLAEFRRFWHCPVLPPAARWRALLAAEGLALLHERDLLPLTRPRTEAELDAAWADLSAALPAKRAQGFGAVAEGELGGVLLERLMRRGAMRYRLMVAARPGEGRVDAA